MSTILELQGLKKYYQTHKAVDDISFSIEQGSIFGLLGPNGAGKTTLLRMITGIFYPDEGQVLFNGQPFNAMEHIRQIGYMPEERGLYKKMKIGEQVLYLAQLRGLSKAEATQRVKYWFEKLDMATWWNKKVEDLSKGMSQKLQFVTTVMHNPQLVILDEPFSGLDPVNANLIKDQIFELAKGGSTIIFSTHRMEQVEEICHQIVLVNLGKKILDGTVQQVRTDFKENIFKLNYEGQLLPEMLATYLFQVKSSGTGSLTLQKDAGTSNNELLQYFMQKGLTITGFSEVLPSLNDIFIRLVKDTHSISRSFEQA
ncbi:MAG TPA: ABC transporter ATP-binding protein [Chitinophagaceae bacterium]|jgi:ABC-2 type transport system ATP-binding protein|nr:ABC transporter ATP-binding protein [Chitinophagaceae bacterium]HAN38278.1 ABC transporter ATP-binding protein [Chitinophagaceae bacterium]